MELTDNKEFIPGLTYSVNHYESYSKSGDKNYFEEIVENMIVDGVAGMNDSFRRAISRLPKDQKRASILNLIERNINLFKKIKALSDSGINRMDHIKDIVVMLRDYVKVGEVEKKKFGEVMTPISLVEEMLDTLPIEVWSNPDLKWLDPANGVGVFPCVIIMRLMEGLKEWEPDTEKRYKHIIENMIYVCELQPKNMFLYLCAVDPFDTNACNIYTGSFLEDGFDYHMKTVWGVDKFDIVVGNPPYQEMDGGFKASAKPIYNIFTEKAINLTKLLLFVTPSRWFAGGKGLDKFREMMMTSNKIKVLNHFDDASKIFGNEVDIKGGVSYFLFDNNHFADCIFNGIRTHLSNFDVVVKPEYISIANKIIHMSGIDNRCDNSNSFKLDYRGANKSIYTDTKLNDNFKTVYTSKSKGFVNYVDSKHIKKLNNNIRVATPRAATKGGEGFGNLFKINKDEYTTDAYITFRCSSTEEAESMLSYLRTKTANFLLGLRKISQDIKPDTCKWIPIVPFDREWTDEMLFEHFGFTDEEKEIINKFSN